MLFNTFGNPSNPVVIMLAGSFCPAESMDFLYLRLKESFFVIAPTYNGCHEGSKAFTSRSGEAEEICAYIAERGVTSVKMVYGQSMGCEVGIELVRQLIENGIEVEYSFWDGAPCASLPKPVRRIMLALFRSFINAVRGKTLEQAMDIGLIKMMSNNDPQALKPMVEPILTVAPYMTDESVKNQVECCYTFDFPKLPESVEKGMHFFYGKSEKAYKLSYKGTKKAYPNADYIVKDGYGHCTYAVKNTDDYIEIIRKIIK